MKASSLHKSPLRKSAAANKRGAAVARGAEPLWFKEAVIYQVHVRAFRDGDGDGMGDFRGLTDRLDYLSNLGVTAIWVLPFYPSPWRDDGYDISDYCSIHPSYGTLRDFQTFLKEAHRRGLRVITELVINHTSDQHAWFQRARQARPGSKERDYYVWSDSVDRYAEARIIFKDFETSNWTWDPVAQAYYWHRFYSHQPDLNFDNPAVCKAILGIADFWFDLGVDGMRLDAVPYLFEREGTNCENLPETHGFLKELRKHIDENYPNRMLLAEANQWPEDAAAYFGDGDECHMAFHFPVMPRLFMGIHLEDRHSIVDILNQTPPIPFTCQWAMFLRNHDELTLEMVTDEERDYMYRAYAAQGRARINLGIRRRLAPLLGNNRRRLELMNSLLLSLPGTPVIYYGDEIGMGDNVFLGDRNGVRTPMQWSPDRNAGFSKANPQQLYLPLVTDPEYSYEAVNVEIQEGNTGSFLWWTKRIIALRRKRRVFGLGSLEFLNPENRKVLAFIRSHEGEHVLVVANLSRFAQCVELDLRRFAGHEPVELFGATRFRVVREEPYMLTLGPHSFFWFSLEPSSELRDASSIGPADEIVLPFDGDFQGLFAGRPSRTLEQAVIRFLSRSRWFGGKGRRIREISSVRALPLDSSGSPLLILVNVAYADGESDSYLLSVAHMQGDRALELASKSPHLILATLKDSSGGEPSIMVDALADPRFGELLIDLIRHRRSIRRDEGRLVGSRTSSFKRLADDRQSLHWTVLGVEQSNSSLVYRAADGLGRMTLKLMRRLQSGVNPELEIGRVLSDGGGFEAAAPLAGAIEFQRDSQTITLAIMHGFVANEGDAWSLTLDAASSFLEQALAWQTALEAPPALDFEKLAAAEFRPTNTAAELIGRYLELAGQLGQRTAELHAALGGRSEPVGFLPEPMTDHYRRSLYHAILSRLNAALQLVAKRLSSFSSEAATQAYFLLEKGPALNALLRPLMTERIPCKRIRIHGDYHLGQVLFTGRDFVIIDFEGEPARPISERRIKRSPLVDVAGMLRSFDYAAQTVLHQSLKQGATPDDQRARPVEAINYWTRWVEAAYLSAYFRRADSNGLLPKTPEHRRLLTTSYLLEKGAYEIQYEINNRPEWVSIPIRGLLRLLDTLTGSSREGERNAQAK